jgi:tRNA pseudouridine55 synthase
VREGTEAGTFGVRVTCSSGTYVRVLAADLGAALGGGAHLRRLRRTRVGSFTAADASTLQEIEAALAEGDDSVLRPPLDALGHLGKLTVTGAVRTDVAHGRPLERAAIGAVGPGPFALVDHAGELLAVYDGRPDDDTVRASVVLAPA